MKKNQHGANCSQSKHPTKYPVSKVSTTTNNGDGDEMVNNHESDTEPKCITLIVNGGTASYKKGVSNSYKSGEVMYIQNLLSESSNGWRAKKLPQILKTKSCWYVTITY